MGRWVFQTPEVRYAFTLCRVVEAGTLDERYDLLGTVQVNANPREPEALQDRLHPWALATLTAGAYGFGRYYAALGTLDEAGEPDRQLAESQIDWSGTAILVPAGDTPPPILGC
ncbi:hypothetical protein [Micromonospora sp. NBC_01796]|uniref:hypothetical protein n=1 Tax=Micromonospora sp. NBC_01796 TaxID=2975987 RepID=UPI002DDAD93D|nr:hypothetical protein [Micromonospora sp. NBC_01796]WSA88465.1 hypothetical protein OIE47_13150 [Micromonospora sp. NBC_01796]